MITDLIRVSLMDSEGVSTYTYLDQLEASHTLSREQMWEALIRALSLK